MDEFCLPFTVLHLCAETKQAEALESLELIYLAFYLKMELN